MKFITLGVLNKKTKKIRTVVKRGKEPCRLYTQTDGTDHNTGGGGGKYTVGITYLLTPWSRVLLEKLTSKLCS
jgi:hypothetical protein